VRRSNGVRARGRYAKSLIPQKRPGHKQRAALRKKQGTIRHGGIFEARALRLRSGLGPLSGPSDGNRRIERQSGVKTPHSTKSKALSATAESLRSGPFDCAQDSDPRRVRATATETAKATVERQTQIQRQRLPASRGSSASRLSMRRAKAGATQAKMPVPQKRPGHGRRAALHN
jgi:hypothetical protein